MKNKFALILAMGFLSSLSAQAQDLEEMNLEDLMNVDVQVASDTSRKLREAPGIVTVLNRQDIKTMGARDLRDILESVPGMTFGVDVVGVYSTINRGIWANEGRVLLLVDGIEMNETSYGTIQLNNHLPADHIEKIEIIRGPGSAIYGGFAELGVIKVTTRSGANLNGVEVSQQISQTQRTTSQSTTNFMLGKAVDQLEFSLKGSLINGQMSDRRYTDETGRSIDLVNKTPTHNLFLDLQFQYKSLYMKYIKDDFETASPVLWGDLATSSGALRKPVPKQFNTDAYEFGIDKQLNESWRFNSYIKHKVQRPWYQPDVDGQTSLENSWRRRNVRDVYGTKVYFDKGSRFNLVLGSEYTKDQSFSLNRFGTDGTTPDVFGHNGKRSAGLNNKALFTQMSTETPIANLTAGVRYDKPNMYRDTLVPRFAATKVFGKSHLKLLYAKAFRAPVIENISLNQDIKPEITTTQELEYGVALNQNLTLTGNVFRTKVEDIIVYSYDSGSSTEHYNNYDHIITTGGELELRYKNDWHLVRSNVSYYELAENHATPFKSMDSSASIGAPMYKVWLSDAISLTQNFMITPEMVFYGDTHAKKWKNGTWKSSEMPNQFITHLMTSYRDFLTPGFELSGGVRNIFNTPTHYYQPYVKPGDYQMGPYPGLNREYVAKVTYSFSY